MRATRSVLALVAVALLGSACADSLPGTAAYVGPGTISVDTLQAQVDDVVAYRSGPGAVQGAPNVRTDLPRITRQVLSQDVVHELVGAAVRRTNFTVDEAQLRTELAGVDRTSTLAQPAQVHVTPRSVDGLLRDQLILAQLGRQAWDGLSLDIDYVVVGERSEAEALVRRMATSDEAAAAVVREAGGRSGQPLTPGTAGSPAVLSSPLFSVPVGGAVAISLIDPQTQGERWLVVRVLRRRTDAPPPTTANSVRAAQAATNDAVALGLGLLGMQAGEPEIRLNPRYGQWDPTSFQVISTTDAPAAVVVDS